MDLTTQARELIDLSKLNYQFKRPPLLVGGVAMMFHGLRESSKDIDFILSREDHLELAKSLRSQEAAAEFVNLAGDHGILVHKFELWDNINQFGYEDLLTNAISEKDYLVISLEKLLVLCTLRGAYKDRYLDDAKLIAKHLVESRHAKYLQTEDNYWQGIA